MSKRLTRYDEPVALEVDCPQCGAPKGIRCRTSGMKLTPVHASRLALGYALAGKDVPLTDSGQRKASKIKLDDWAGEGSLGNMPANAQAGVGSNGRPGDQTMGAASSERLLCASQSYGMDADGVRQEENAGLSFHLPDYADPCERVELELAILSARAKRGLPIGTTSGWWYS